MRYMLIVNIGDDNTVYSSTEEGDLVDGAC